MPEAFLDTNIILRYLTREPEDLALRAAGIVDSEANLLVTEGIIAEVAYVLSKNYHVDRAAVVDGLIAFVRKSNVMVWQLEKDVVIEALGLCRPSGRVSFVDALLWAVARSSGVETVYSLDERFPDSGIDVRAAP